MIKENRRKKKMTQEQLAELIGITPQHLQTIEKDERRTKITTMQKIIKILDIPDNEILDFMKKRKYKRKEKK